MNTSKITEFISLGSRDISVFEIIFSTSVSAVLLLIVFVIYRQFYKGILYSASFGSSLIMVGMITTFVILTIKSNLILSLGLVGALSIVRFRTAVKDAIDIAYMFWVIAIGLACGAGMYSIAIIATLILSLIAIFLKKVPNFNQSYLLTLVLNQEKENFDKIKKFGNFKLRNKSKLDDGKVSITFEVSANEKNIKVIEDILSNQNILYTFIRIENNYTT